MKLKGVLVIIARAMVIIGAIYAAMLAVTALFGDLENVYEATKPGILIWIAAAFAVVMLYKFAEVCDDSESEKRD